MKLTQKQIKDFTLYIDLNDVRQFIKSEKYTKDDENIRRGNLYILKKES